MASTPPTPSGIFGPLPASQGPTTWGGGHYPPPTGGHVYAESSLYDVLGPIFGAHWHKAAAIVMAESGGDTHARNVNKDGSVDRGPFQINSRAHPEVPDAVAYDMHGAALAAFAISKGGTDWHQWATDKQTGDGSQVKLPNADDAGLLGVGRGTGLDTKVSDAAQSISDGFLSKLGVLFKSGFWLRVLLVLGGGALLVFAVVTIGKQYAPTGMVADAVAAVA